MIKPLLVLVSLGLAGLLYVQWSDWPPPETSGQVPEAPDASGASPQPEPVVELAPLEDKEDYAAVTERPLFRPDRRPEEDEPKDEPDAPLEEASDLAGMDVTGILIAPKLTSAWVKDPSQPAPVRLRPGETLAGWTVKDILADRLVMERQGKTDELLLRAFAPPGTAPLTPTPRQPPAVRRPASGPTPQRAAVPPGQPPRVGVPGSRAQTGAPVQSPAARRRLPAGNPNARPNVRQPIPTR
jgi:general secretion pathway protein N